PVGPLSSVSASRNSSLAMNWSPRLVASLSVRLSRLLRSREIVISPPVPSTFGRLLISVRSAACTRGTLTPARASSDAVPASSCARSAASKCAGSMKPLSWPRARLWASDNACWNLVVSLSKRMVGEEFGAFDRNTQKMRRFAPVSSLAIDPRRRMGRQCGVTIDALIAPAQLERYPARPLPDVDTRFRSEYASALAAAGHVTPGCRRRLLELLRRAQG